MNVRSILLPAFVLAAAITPNDSIDGANLPQGYVVGWGANALYGCDGVPSPRESAGVVTMAGHVLSNAIAITAGYGKSTLLSDGTVILPVKPLLVFGIIRVTGGKVK